MRYYISIGSVSILLAYVVLYFVTQININAHPFVYDLAPNWSLLLSQRALEVAWLYYRPIWHFYVWLVGFVWGFVIWARFR